MGLILEVVDQALTQAQDMHVISAALWAGLDLVALQVQILLV